MGTLVLPHGEGHELVIGPAAVAVEELEKAVEILARIRLAGASRQQDREYHAIPGGFRGGLVIGPGIGSAHLHVIAAGEGGCADERPELA